MDKKIITVEPLPAHALKKAGMGWLAVGENEGYIAPAVVQMTGAELALFKQAASQLYPLMLRAAGEVVAQNRWAEVGIPEQAVELVKYSFKHEMGLHLISRFDFAGGLEGLPLKMLELNADTCSLMPETATVQSLLHEQNRRKLPDGQPFNQLEAALVKKLRGILQRFPEKDSLLLSTFGHAEDWLNTGVITAAAKKSGFAEVQEMQMEAIIFSPEEGFFIEINEQEYRRFDLWFKFIPWELLVLEEPEVFSALKAIVMNGLGTVLNPAYTMLLQSKALMKIMWEMEPGNPLLLKTSLIDRDFADRRFVRKPIFGRMGENIAYFDGGSSPIYETDGDYGDFPTVSQEFALFNLDRQLHRYQPSVFWTDEPAALCFRRQDDPILDDDAEFVGHVVGG